MSKQPINHFADMTDEEFDKTSAMDSNELKAHNMRKAASIVNGGESTAARAPTIAQQYEEAAKTKPTSDMVCPDCRGGGVFIAYTGRRVGPCFKCKGTGALTVGQAAYVKGEKTKEEKREEWRKEYAAEIAYMTKRMHHWPFARKMLDNIAEYGSLTENQMLAIQKAMTEDAVKNEEWAKTKERNSGDVDLAAITKLFDTARSHNVKRPIWRAAGFEINLSRNFNDNTLWVKDATTRQNLGKVMDGKFIAFHAAQEGTLAKLQEIAADPTAAAIAYKDAYNRCCCCGRSLKTNVSVVAGVGPVCAENWGLDTMRTSAAVAVKEERAAHKEPKIVKTDQKLTLKTKAVTAKTATPPVAQRTGTKKQFVADLLFGGGSTIAEIAEILDIGAPAARALIGDVKRMGHTVVREGDTYRIRS